MPRTLYIRLSFVGQPWPILTYCSNNKKLTSFHSAQAFQCHCENFPTLRHVFSSTPPRHKAHRIHKFYIGFLKKDLPQHKICWFRQLVVRILFHWFESNDKLNLRYSLHHINWFQTCFNVIFPLSLYFQKNVAATSGFSFYN